MTLLSPCFHDPHLSFSHRSSPENAQSDKTEARSSITASNLFRLLVPQMKCENSDMRDTVVNGMGCCNPAVFKSVSVLPLVCVFGLMCVFTSCLCPKSVCVSLLACALNPSVLYLLSMCWSSLFHLLSVFHYFCVFKLRHKSFCVSPLVCVSKSLCVLYCVCIIKSVSISCLVCIKSKDGNTEFTGIKSKDGNRIHRYQVKRWKHRIYIYHIKRWKHRIHRYQDKRWKHRIHKYHIKRWKRRIHRYQIRR